MRILHINCNYLGTTLHQCMIKHMDEFGIQSQVYVPTYDASKSVIVPNSNVCVSECFNKWDRVWFYHKQKKIINDIENKIDVKSFDVIHAYTLFTDGNCAMQLHKKYGVPYVVAIRNTDVNAFFKYMIHLRHRGIEIMKNASAIFFLSPAYKQQVFDKYVPSDERKALLAKTYIIPNGIDDFWFKNKPIERKNEPGNNISIVYAGNIDKNKNLLATATAISNLIRKGYKIEYNVAGKIKDRTVFDKLTKCSFFNYLGVLNQEELIKIYRANDIFVMPSIYETFGLVYVEALSQGLPIIYTRGQGFDGWFDDGVVGYGVSSDLKNMQLENAIIKCIDKNLTVDIRKTYLFKWELIVKEYISIYRCIRYNT